MNLLFITSNKNKLREIQLKISNEIHLQDLSSINFVEEIPEPFETLHENALAKAKFIHDRFAINCFAEDSGFFVEALNGEPGVYSARYAGEQKNDADNIEKVLSKLKNITNRNAFFCTVIALIINDKEFLFEGKIHGVVTENKIGESGFGYDPIFIPNGNNLTFAQIDIAEKNRISHRAIAVEKMVEFLQKNNF
jgi:XTP/dITP diphosphohydrolase